MPRRKKRANELTTDEAMKRLFPKKVRETAQETAEKARKKGKS
jgi:hypothetical protein